VLNLQPQTVLSNLPGMAVGVDLGQLLLQALDYIFGVAYPLTVSERHNDQQLARKTLHGGIIKRAFTGQCWLMAACCCDAPACSAADHLAVALQRMS
jgi:hypothetical protein